MPRLGALYGLSVFNLLRRVARHSVDKDLAVKKINIPHGSIYRSGAEDIFIFVAKGVDTVNDGQCVEEDYDKKSLSLLKISPLSTIKKNSKLSL
ncbi:hypothetical protein MTBPR1_30004 [Candidatus Terasakiella magnetica]|uniref:Uncharacterized protein n=1 Tax=Candidatus Terasakiella magnetica TaxID=1867952 RepID=A0A1C3RHG0_9PROT|nr:hypothetical protein MTBPR1_30004 [Candidatus Terasakiella magnetica]